MDDPPVRIDSLDAAFEAFRPSLYFAASVGEGIPELVAELEFANIGDFEPRNVLEKVPDKRNDVALLGNTIGQLSYFKDWWLLPGVRCIWDDPKLRDRMLTTPVDLLNELKRSPQEKQRIQNTAMEATHAEGLFEEILFGLPPWIETRKGSLIDLFSSETGNAFIDQLMDMRSRIPVTESHEQILQNIEDRISKAEQLRDALMKRLYQQLRPLEASYRLLELFYENSAVPDGKRRPPVELFVFNADASAMKDRESVTLEGIRRFVKSRNDNYNFRDDIWHLVVPGAIPMLVRKALEEEAWKWGMLLITDLGDERSSEDIERQLAPGGRYELLGRADGFSATDIVTVGYLKLRNAHWFEQDISDGDGLYAPASLVFAGALARTDRNRKDVLQSRPLGTMFGRIMGVEKARVEFPINRAERLAQQMQLIAVTRGDDNHLCFYGCECPGDEPYEVYKFFTPFRIVSFLDRVVRNRLREVAGQMLTKDFLEEEIGKPIKRLLDMQKDEGVIAVYDLLIDKDLEKLKRGICNVFLKINLLGDREILQWKLETPYFCASAQE